MVLDGLVLNPNINNRMNVDNLYNGWDRIDPGVMTLIPLYCFISFVSFHFTIILVSGLQVQWSYCDAIQPN